MPKITSGVASAPLSQVDTPLLAVAVAQSSAVPASLADLDRAAGGVVARVIASGDFKGKRDETTLLYLSGAKPGRVLLVGLGKPGEVSRNTIRRAAAVAAKRARALGAKQLAFTVVPEARNGVSARDLGQAAVEGVAQGAWAFTELKATPDEPKPEVEGLTFDSGGIEIKPAQNMEDMKFDMSGAAAVLGTFETLGLLKPKVNVVGLIPATENLPSGHAVKPGDVVKSHFGKTIEIINTDAEGRLILCDALSYVRRFKPAAVIDIATLTGAVVVALGQVAIGEMGNDEALLAEVREAGERAGERCWPLPLWDEYRDLLKSDIADVKNSGGRGAGSIAGGWFLREFVEGYPWVHLDIAGTAYTDAEGPHQAKGPTAVGVRLFTEFILKRAGA